MAIAGGVFHQQYLSCIKHTLIAKGGLDLNNAIHKQYVLAGGRIMKIIVILLYHLPEDNIPGFLGIRQETDLPTIIQRNADVFKMAVAISIGIYPCNGKFYYLKFELSHSADKATSSCTRLCPVGRSWKSTLKPMSFSSCTYLGVACGGMVGSA